MPALGTVYGGGYNGVTAAFIELTVQWGHQHEINKPILRNCDKRFKGHAPSVTRESVEAWGSCPMDKFKMRARTCRSLGLEFLSKCV